ncbi:MAG: NAD(P)-dependent glycerol-1-phosphate dehydrogenase [ANME-2 cluster archaeon]|nr:NAD(P)-dependent glycerol-1-phosphate dehydrogenase [ANME-2 cluster archaeon]
MNELNADISSSRWMLLPRNVVVGNSVINDIGNVCNALKLNGNALIVSGPTTLHKAAKTVAQVLEDTGCNVHSTVVERAEISEVEKVESLISQFDPKTQIFLLGVGGGKAIDIAKLASYRVGCSFISVPTAASHDGIVSSRASISHDGVSASIEAEPPVAVVADTQIIAKAPFRLLASGCGDIISKCTAVQDWELAHRLKDTKISEYASHLSMMTAKILMDSAESIKPDLPESARMVVKALVASGVAMSIAGSSRPASGSEHKFSHALNQIAPQPALHGEQCGVGSIMMMYLHGGDWQKIRKTLETIGAPINAKELGIDPEDIIKALVNAHTIRPERYTILGTGLTQGAARRIARITQVID